MSCTRWLSKFIQNDELVVKVGRTSRPIFQRLSQYPKNSKMIFAIHVRNPRACVEAETVLLCARSCVPDARARETSSSANGPHADQRARLRYPIGPLAVHVKLSGAHAVVSLLLSSLALYLLALGLVNTTHEQVKGKRTQEERNYRMCPVSVSRMLELVKLRLLRT